MTFLRRINIPAAKVGQVWLSDIRPTNGEPQIKPFKVVSISDTGCVEVLYANWVFEDGWDIQPVIYSHDRQEWRDQIKNEKRYLRSR